MKDLLNKINNQVQPYYLLVTMLLFFIGIFITAYSFIFSPPNLSVQVKQENIEYPSSINKAYETIYSYIADSIEDVNLKASSARVYSYLLETKHQKSIRISNNTASTIHSINIRQPNVRNLVSWAVSSSFLLEEEKNKVIQNILYQEKTGIIYLKDAVNLPPKGNLTIYLWGDFGYNWDDSSLTVDYDGGNGVIEYTKELTGFDAAFSDYYYIILVAIIITFIIIYFSLIDKYVNNKENSSDNN